MTLPLKFFRAPVPVSVATAAAEIGAQLGSEADPSRMLRAVAALERAGPDDASAFLDGQDPDDLRETRAAACLVTPRHLVHVPQTTISLVVDQPRDALRRLAALLHPGSLRPGSLFAQRGIDASARIAGTARLEPGVTVEAGAMIGPDAEIGAGTFIGAGTVVGEGVRIGRDCAIDAGVVMGYALVGDRVIVHAGARVGHAECGVAAGRRMPSLGCVIVQNDVEIGANATIARGQLGDTIIGEGARVEALVTIAADALIDRNARIRQRDRAL